MVCDLLADVCVVVYMGHMNVIKGVDVLAVMVVGMLDVLYVWVGGETGKGTEFVEQCVVEVGVDNVCLFGWVLLFELVAYLYAFDMLLILFMLVLFSKHGNMVLFMKTFVYMVVGWAIVVGDQLDI